MSRSTSNIAQPKRNVTRVAPQGGRPKKAKANRDPKNLNKHIQVDFYSVLAEPRGVHSFDCIWTLAESVYAGFLKCCYKLFTCCSGPCIAVYWALQFVPVIFSHVWCLTPFYNLMKILCGFWCKSVFSLCIRCFIKPVTKSCAPLFRYCGDGLIKRAESPGIFPKVERRRKAAPAPAPAPSVTPVVAKQNTPPPVQGEWDNYDKEKIARSVKRQLMLY